MNWYGTLEIGVSFLEVLKSGHLIDLIELSIYNCKHTANSWEYFVPSFIARFPTHPASKWLDHSEKHKDEIDKLHSMDGDFHHGFNSGVLAAARMFKDHTEIDLESAEASSAAKVVIEGSKKSFPDLSCNKFPVVNGESN